jgi:hypothetical protein
MDDPLLTTCFHLYCMHCFSILEFDAKEQGEELATCRMCDDLVHNTIELDAHQVLYFQSYGRLDFWSVYKGDEYISDEDRPESRSIDE